MKRSLAIKFVAVLALATSAAAQSQTLYLDEVNNARRISVDLFQHRTGICAAGQRNNRVGMVLVRQPGGTLEGYDGCWYQEGTTIKFLGWIDAPDGVPLIQRRSLELTIPRSRFRQAEG